jgi:fused signal recognition particle receptor
MILKYLKSGYQKFKSALAKTRTLLGDKIQSLLIGTINEETLEQIEEALYQADLGVDTVQQLTKKIHELYTKNPELKPPEYIHALENELIAIMSPQNPELTLLPADQGPTVILIVGVNGNGKTTAVAKLAKRFKDQGLKVIVGAADTFRAAAIEQLELWAKKLDIEIVKGAPQSDPSAVVFDAVTAAKARNMDVLLIDTAGRLHTKTNLMQELEKIRRTCTKVSPGSPHETLLVIDATTGQNGIDQAKTFQKFTPLSGLILTKLDGTAKGGLVVNIQRQLKIPVKFIGIGEGADDLAPFEAKSFVTALFE